MAILALFMANIFREHYERTVFVIYWTTDEIE
jgi:hypothetical protein